MSNIWDEKRKAQEEDYFRKRDQELIEKARQKQAEEAQAAAATFACPKCDGRLEEISFMDIHIDRCNACSGVWLDAGELEQIARQEDSGWLGKFLKNR